MVDLPKIGMAKKGYQKNLQNAKRAQGYFFEENRSLILRIMNCFSR
jgi:hypothetical protein